MTTRRGMTSLFRLAWRESRTARRRLFLYMSSISFGVAALVAIDSFSQNVTQSVHEQSRALMGGDASITSRQPLATAIDSTLEAISRRDGMQVAKQVNFPSMVVNPRLLTTRLVDVRAITAGYPLYGSITSAPAESWRELHGGRNLIVDRGLLVTLGASIGDSLTLGNAAFRVSGVIQSVPGDVGIAAVVGPRVYVSQSNIPATGLLGFGSRASYEAVVKLDKAMSAETFLRLYDRP